VPRKEKVAEEVAVKVPTPRLPVVEEETRVFMKARGEVVAEYVMPEIELCDQASYDFRKVLASIVSVIEPAGSDIPPESESDVP
jgi:hypothetical protein